ncbi:WLM domain-containing protein [Phyllosticta citricarpa]|uniref:WLM domain-containing protein n=1 Tax=Phyllosticta citricarpa TaxID=55181 RepID=A0ABR1L5P2_9PEZI
MARGHEFDPLFGNFVHLQHLPRANEAQLMLKKLASVVKPIMRKRNWKVGQLGEFLPEQANLLGLNVNHGQKIWIRLRYPNSTNKFMDYDVVADTLLHELSHNAVGPHNAQFHKLWNELREEYWALKRQGYTGEGFLSDGHRLGGRRIPLHETRRQARIAAEKRKTLNTGSGQKVGGRAVTRGTDMRKAIADAVSRRTEITKGCGHGDRDAEKRAEEEAKRLGFSTKAEMEDANQIAIAIAMMEGEQDADRAVLQQLASQSREGLTWSPDAGLEMAPPPLPPNKPSSAPPSIASSSASSSSTRSKRPVSRLVAEPSRNRPRPSDIIDLTDERPSKKPSSVISSASSSLATPSTWICEICTLINQSAHLCCDACGVERPSPPEMPASRARSSTTSSIMHPLDRIPPPREKPLGWNCIGCGTFMEQQWWTCSACGILRPDS